MGGRCGIVEVSSSTTLGSREMTDMQLLDIFLLTDRGQVELNRAIYCCLTSFLNCYNHVLNGVLLPKDRLPPRTQTARYASPLSPHATTGLSKDNALSLF